MFAVIGNPVLSSETYSNNTFFYRIELRGKEKKAAEQCPTGKTEWRIFGLQQNQKTLPFM